jgi:nucleoside-diphosphate-sugar epimerase
MKRHFNDYAARFAAARGIGFVDLELEHVYGPGDDATKFVPALIRALVGERSAFDLTPGEQRRDFVYVTDVVAAYLQVLEHRADFLGATTRVEVGSGEAVALADFVRLARDVAGSGTRLNLGALPYRAGELMHSVADLEALRRLGWAPAVSLREGLARTVSAARASSSAAAARAAT